MNKVLLLFVLLLAPAWAAQAQSPGVIAGVVTDDTGEPLPGAQVLIVGTTLGAATGFDGDYRIVGVSEGTYTLRASFVGYSSEEAVVTVGAGATVTQDFTLATDLLQLSDVVVTGVVNPVSKLESSVSITTLGPEQIEASAPRTTAEIFRTIPGIRSEASGGDGNTNITVRGVPISAGGSKYLQLQEDGLPIFLYGDIAFATSDIFLRADPTLARIEAIRGGSASTLASNSPAGIINFISKTGEVEGGSISTSTGLDYNSTRVGFEYGSPIGDDLGFHVGGFFRSGEGQRDTGYLAEQGGQIKANLTKLFDTGYARIYAKYLNDRTPAYLPMPIQVTGTNDDPSWESIDGFSATLDTPHSVFLQSNVGFGADGQRRRVNIADGMHPVSQAVGVEFLFDVGDGWTVENKGRFALNSGRFVSPFTAGVGPTADIAAGAIGATGRSLDSDGDEVDDIDFFLTRSEDGSAFNGDLLQSIVLFDTELKNFDNLFNDARVSKSFEGLGEGLDNVTVTGGLFKGIQRINMAWLWNSYLLSVEGDNASPIDITLVDADQDTTGISQDGLFAYGAAPFGNCCAVEFDATYDVTAPYFALGVEALDGLTVDGSIRYDYGRVTGVGSGGTTASLDVNNDGVISPVEETVNVIDLAQKNPVDYTYDYWSYSVGANFAFLDNAAVFGRFSRGAAAKADRAIFPDGTYLDPIQFGPKDQIDQAELGYKQQFRQGGLFITGFYAQTTEEGGFEATTQQLIESDYQAFGVEVEGSYSIADLAIRAAATYTNAEITSGDNEGNKPRRQPDLMFSIVPTYHYDRFGIGLSVIGQTSAYAQDSNELVMPGYAIVNGFIDVDIADGLSLSVAANNLFDTIGITESEEGAITDGQVNYLRARSVTGRTISAGVRYTF